MLPSSTGKLSSSNTKYCISINVTPLLYSSNSYEDELIWAAAWLYRATGDASYLTKAEDMYASKSQNWMWSFDWSDKLPGAQLLLFELTGKDKYKTDVEAFCDYAMGITQSPGGQTHLTEWGSNRHASNLAFICLGVNIQNRNKNLELFLYNFTILGSQCWY